MRRRFSAFIFATEENQRNRHMHKFAAKLKCPSRSETDFVGIVFYGRSVIWEDARFLL